MSRALHRGSPERAVRLLILGSAGDATSAALADLLRARHGVAAVQRRSLEELAAARWTHRLGAAGVPTDLRFSDGATFNDVAPTLLFNRLEFVPTLLFARMAPADRDYARAEFYALLLSWLSSLGERVVNRPTPSALWGPALRPWQWNARAAEAGLPPYPGAVTTSLRRAPAPPDAMPRPDLLPAADEAALAQLGLARPFAHSPRPHTITSVLVLGERLVGGVGVDDAATTKGCVRLARAVGADVLAVNLAQTEGDPRWRFLNADARPQVTDEAMLGALAEWIEARA